VIPRPHQVAPSLDTARVVFVYKSADPSAPSHAGLGIVCVCNMKTLRRSGVWAEVWPASCAAMLKERLTAAESRAHAQGQLPPTHVIINALWIQTVDLTELAYTFPDVTFVVVSHSNWGFLAADPTAVKLLREAVELQHSTHNVRVAGNCEKFARTATDVWGANVAALPNLYDLSEPLGPARQRWSGDTLRIGLFGAARVLKNGLTAAAAATELAARLHVPTELHLSTDRDGGGTVRSIQELTEDVPNLKLVDHGWLPWAKFRKVVGHMHVLLQPSFTESFNIVTADGIAEGVPSVVSEAIDWAPERWQAHADNAGDVARVAEYLLHNPQAVDDGRKALRCYVDDGVDRWRGFLSPPIQA
jgi:hypothetical protein